MAVVALAHVVYFVTVRHSVDGYVLRKTRSLWSDKSVDLAAIPAADRHCEVRRVSNGSGLRLRVRDIRILIGARLAWSYYEPEGLLAIAHGLEKSIDPRARDVASVLRALAADPTRRSWPRF